MKITGAVAQGEQNIIHSLNKSIILKSWKITRDLSPKDIIHLPADSSWKLLNVLSLNEKYAEGNWIISTDVLISDTTKNKTVVGLFPINFITAYEIYWDGIKISQNGTIGINSKDEKSGSYDFSLPLSPNLLTPGIHKIMIRISNYHNSTSWKWYYGGVIIGPYGLLLKNIYKLNFQAFFTIGILFIPFLFNLFLYIARKRKTEHLLFSLICLIVILDSITSLIPIFIKSPTTFIPWQYFAYHIYTAIITVLFPAFFIYMFSFPRKIIGLIGLVNLIIFLFFTDLWNIYFIMSLVVLIESSLISGWSLFKRKEGSIIIFVGLLVAWAAFVFNLAFAGMAAIMVVCTSFSIARQFARKEKAEKEAQLRSADLENQLLKKNINPHFLLNTLTSIIVWLRKDSKSAIKLIETLAEEFRMITQISALKQISLRQEVDLCEAHIKIMNFRKGSEYKLETEGLVDEENIPPMIFHTLIENGLTHGYENKLQGTFLLKCNKNSNCVQYILSNDGDFTEDGPKDSGGIGIRYIKNRLEESYPDRWYFSSHRKDNGWETIIEIKDYK